MIDAELAVIVGIQRAYERARGAGRGAGSRRVLRQIRIGSRDGIDNTKRHRRVADEQIELCSDQVEEQLLRAIAAAHVHNGDGLRLAVNATANGDILDGPGARMVFPVAGCEAAGELLTAHRT